MEYIKLMIPFMVSIQARWRGPPASQMLVSVTELLAVLKRTSKGFRAKNIRGPQTHWSVDHEDIFNSSKLSLQKKMFYHLVQINVLPSSSKLVQINNFCLQELLLQQ